MKPVRINQTGPGSTQWVPLDVNLSPFCANVVVDVTGTVNYTVELTADDLFDPTVTPTARNSSLAAQTASGSLPLTVPWTGVRLTQASGAGTCRLTVLQGLKG